MDRNHPAEVLQKNGRRLIIINPAAKDVIPAVAKRRAGIQEPIYKTGFPLPDRSPGQAPREWRYVTQKLSCLIDRQLNINYISHLRRINVSEDNFRP